MEFEMDSGVTSKYELGDNTTVLNYIYIIYIFNYVYNLYYIINFQLMTAAAHIKIFKIQDQVTKGFSNLQLQSFSRNSF